MSHESCGHARSVETDRMRELKACDRTRRACPSAPPLRLWGKVPVSVGTSIENYCTSLPLSVSDASARRPSSPTTTSVPPFVCGDAMLHPRADAVRAPASEGQLEGRGITDSFTFQPESFESASPVGEDEVHAVTDKGTSMEELSWNAVAHRRYSTSASFAVQTPTAAPLCTATVAVPAGVRTHHASAVEEARRGDSEPTRTHLHGPWMTPSTFPSPAVAEPLQLVVPPPPTPLSAVSHSTVPSSLALAIPPQHTREEGDAHLRGEPLPSSSSSSPSPSHPRQVYQATPVRGHSRTQRVEDVQGTNASSPIAVCVSGTPPVPLTSAFAIAAEQNDRRTCEDEAREMTSTSGEVVGERGDCCPAAKSRTPRPARVLQDGANNGHLVTSAVADVSAESSTTPDGRRGRLADTLQPEASAYSFSPPPSSIVRSSCGIVRILQLQDQEGWQDRLRVALQQDAEVWVRQVCEEQRLLQAQLSVAQARAAALAKSLQVLYDRGWSSAPSLRPPSQPMDSAGVPISGASEKRCEERITAERPCIDGINCKARAPHLAEYSLKKSAVREDSSEGVYTSSAADDATAAAFGTAYTHKLEAYIRLLEQHTHTLHSDKHQLQLRLDRQTSQLAMLQQYYQQHYARLLQEQSALERDSRKATEDVEELVGMLVVTRAAERAAMRRAEEFELALEKSELRAETLAAALHPQVKGNHRCDTEGSIGTITPISETIVVGPHRCESLHCTSGYASGPLPSSAFASFVEHDDTERSIMEMDALTAAEAASRTASVERRRVLAGRSTSASSSMCPPLPPGASSLTVESPGWTPMQALTTSIGPECSCDVEHTWGRTGSSLSAVQLSVTPSAMRIAAEVESNDAGDVCSPEVCVAAKLVSRDEGIVSQPPCAPWQAVTAPPTLAPLPNADAIAIVSTAAMASHGSASSRKLSCEVNSDGAFASTALTAAPVPAEREEARNASVSVTMSPTSSSTSVFTPPTPTATTLLTPRSLARRRRHVQHQIKALRDDTEEGNASDAADEYQLLRLRCTLLELELQAKEAAHRAEKEAWETAVHHAEDIRGAMGEVEARVSQAAAASERAKELLREMSQLWSNSLALDEDDVIDDDSEGAAGATGLLMMDKGQAFSPHRSHNWTPLHWRNLEEPSPFRLSK
ncbi:hypothetical protein, conserved [Leishmania shawi]|uniref:Flagellum transition zone component n=1 Tax=Leishmania shawi TaxID=5680 RepID=A0ABR3E6Z2_9TRYP